MATSYIHYPPTGVPTYPSFASLPASANDGALAVTTDTDNLYVYNAASGMWVQIGGPGTVTSIGPFGSTPNNNGGDITAGVLTLEPADATHPGGVSTTTQSFGGAKTFVNDLTVTSGVANFGNNSATTGVSINGGAVQPYSSATNDNLIIRGKGTTGRVFIGYNAGAGAFSLYNGGTTNPISFVNTGGQLFITPTSQVTVNGNLAATGVGLFGDGVTLGAQINNGVIFPYSANINDNLALRGKGSGSVDLAYGGGTGGVNIYPGTTSNPVNFLNTAGNLTITPTTSVTIAGTISASNLSGTNTGNVTIGTANGLSLAAQALSLGLSSTSTTGALSSTDWNTFNGKGSGSVTSVSVTTANGVSGSVATATTTPAITLTLGAITPSSVAASGTVTGSNLSGTNTGDQTITLTSDVTGSGTGSFATTVAKIQGTTVTGTTGTVAAVLSTSPTIITPTLSGTTTSGAINASGNLVISSNVAGNQGFQTTNTNTAAGSSAQYRWTNDATHSVRAQLSSSAGFSSPITGGVSTESFQMYTDTTIPFVLGTNSTAAITIDGTTQKATLAGALTVTGITTMSSSIVAKETFDGTTSGTVNNLSSTGRSIIELAASTTITLNGISAGVSGQIIWIVNITGNSLTINNNSGSATGAKILTPGAVPFVVTNQGVVELIYINNTSNWYVVGK